MLDPNQLRRELDTTAQALQRRGFQLDKPYFTELENRRKSVQVETENLQARRNAVSKLIGQLKSQGKDASAEITESQTIPDQLKKLEAELNTIQTELNTWLANIPNLPHESVPAGDDESHNVEQRRWLACPTDDKGNPKPFNFAPKDHVELGEKVGLDFQSARKLAGSRFMMLRGQLAKLHRALAHFMLDVQTNEHGYEECYTPYMANEATLFGTGQLPKFKDDMFWVTKGGSHHDDEDNSHSELYLISTSEITLTGSARDSILPADALPMRLTAHTPCFRSEAGSGGRDIRGIIRQHQFDKVELVQLVHPSNSYEALEEMVGHAETILQKLGLSYRVVLLCGGDMGFSAAKTYDLEVWLPAQQTWREISSISNCEAFQARRLQARFRNEKGRPEYLHTLNGSGLAVGRALVAVLENYQNEDGSITIPEVLRSYMGGQERLTPSA